MSQSKSIEVKGRTLDEAIFSGLTELGLGIDQVSYEIIKENNKGIFGIGKSVTIRMSEKKTPASEAETFLDGLFEKMGVPAKAVRRLTEEEILKNRKNAEDYVKEAREYLLKSEVDREDRSDIE